MARSAPHKSVAVVTMVRDDEAFLRLWLSYYGGLFGHRALYVVNHGDGQMVRDLAHQANVIALPGDHHPKFDARRWRLLNHLVHGLRVYHDMVIVGDVDELVVADPDLGSLPEFLTRQSKVPVITPFGLELVHRPAQEPEPMGAPLLSRRRFVRIAPLYAKPCIVQSEVRLSRGGHYASAEKLTMPEGLYLLHLKHCDRQLYVDTVNRRNEVAAATGVARPKDAMIGRHWFSEARDDSAAFAQIDDAEILTGFDISGVRAALHDTWRARAGTGFWEFDCPDEAGLYELPTRFHTLF